MDPEDTIETPVSRRSARHAADLRVVIRYPCDRQIFSGPYQQQQTWARLQDISRHGARLVANRAFRLNALLTIEATVGRPALAIGISALVVWVTRVSEAFWTIGCEFEQQLSHALLKELVVGDESAHLPSPRFLERPQKERLAAKE